MIGFLTRVGTRHPKLKAIVTEWFKIHPGGVYTIVVPANLPRSRTKKSQPDVLTPNQAQDHFQRLVARSSERPAGGGQQVEQPATSRGRLGWAKL